jgi:hypothetical protein
MNDKDIKDIKEGMIDIILAFSVIHHPKAPTDHHLMGPLFR